MEALLDIAKGPLFRLTFALMVLGLARILILDIWGAVEAYLKGADKTIPWRPAIGKAVGSLIPAKRAFGSRSIYGLFSILFHVGLILVPVFLFAHVELWKSGLGFGWITLSKPLADLLTLTTIGFGIVIFIGRVVSKDVESSSGKRGYFWPLLLLVPFVTGYIRANTAISPAAYQLFTLAHILSGELIFVLIPFTKIARCVVRPVSQFAVAIARVVPEQVDDDASTTLDKKGAPV